MMCCVGFDVVKSIFICFWCDDARLLGRRIAGLRDQYTDWGEVQMMKKPCLVLSL